MKMRACLLLLIAMPMLSHETLTTTVLFDREIVRILNNHCVVCHAAGGPSFPLETYDQTWLKKREIHAQVIGRHMPPWAAVPGYGQFANDNSLTLRESQFVISWVEGLGPRNGGTVFLNVTGPDAARPAEVRTHTGFGHWQLGEPQLTRAIPASNVVDLGLTAPRQLRALEYMPADRTSVHAAFFKIQETGQWIGSWTPWYSFSALPKGLAYRVPAGAHIVAEIHYKGGKAVADQGTLGLHFVSESSTNVAPDMVMEARPSAASITTRATASLLVNTRLLSLRPEIPPGTQSIEVAARRPDGTTEVLLFAKDFPPDWPTPYIFKRPVTLPGGTVISLTAHMNRAAGPIRLTINRSEPKPGR